MIRERKQFKNIKALQIVVQFLQRLARIALFARKIRRQIKENNLRAIERYKSLQSLLKQEFEHIHSRKRFEVHISSFTHDELARLQVRHFEQRGSVQLTRLFRLKDPNVNIILICPNELKDEIINYYLKILELSKVPNFKTRLFFVRLDNYSAFPAHLPLIQRLLYSNRSLKRIKSIIGSE